MRLEFHYDVQRRTAINSQRRTKSAAESRIEHSVVRWVQAEDTSRVFADAKVSPRSKPLKNAIHSFCSHAWFVRECAVGKIAVSRVAAINVELKIVHHTRTLQGDRVANRHWHPCWQGYRSRRPGICRLFVLRSPSLPRYSDPL